MAPVPTPNTGRNAGDVRPLPPDVAVRNLRKAFENLTVKDEDEQSTHSESIPDEDSAVEDEEEQSTQSESNPDAPNDASPSHDDDTD